MLALENTKRILWSTDGERSQNGMNIEQDKDPLVLQYCYLDEALIFISQTAIRKKAPAPVQGWASPSRGAVNCFTSLLKFSPSN